MIPEILVNFLNGVSILVEVFFVFWICLKKNLINIESRKASIKMRMSIWLFCGILLLGSLEPSVQNVVLDKPISVTTERWFSSLILEVGVTSRRY